MPIIFDASVFDQTGPDPDLEMSAAIGAFGAGIGQGLKEGMDFERQKQADKEKMELEAKLSLEKAAFEQDFQSREAQKNRDQATQQFNETLGLERTRTNAAVEADKATTDLRKDEREALEDEKKRLEDERKKQEALEDAQKQWQSQYGGLVPSPLQPSWVTEGTYSQEQYAQIELQRNTFMKGYTAPDGTFVPPTPQDIATFDDGVERQYMLDREAARNTRAATGMRTFFNRSLFSGPQGQQRREQLQPYVDAVQDGQMTPAEAHGIMEEQYRDFEETDYVSRQTQTYTDRINIQRKELEELSTKHGEDPVFASWVSERRRRLDEASSIIGRAQTREDFNGVADLLENRGSVGVTKVTPDGATETKSSGKDSFNFIKEVQNTLEIATQFAQMGDTELEVLGASSPVSGVTPLERGRQMRDGIIARAWASLVPPSESSRGSAEQARADVDAALSNEEPPPPAANQPATTETPPANSTNTPATSPAEQAVRDTAATSRATPEQRAAAEKLSKEAAAKVGEQRAALKKTGDFADQVSKAMTAAKNQYSQASGLAGVVEIERIKDELAKAKTSQDLEKVLAKATKQFDALKELRSKVDSRMRPTPGEAASEADVNDYKLIESVLTPLGELVNALDNAIEMQVDPKDLGL